MILLDICKIIDFFQVCNKYFLRTHMLKMHNIVIDENKTVIANIDTLEKEKNGGLTFRFVNNANKPISKIFQMRYLL